MITNKLIEKLTEHVKGIDILRDFIIEHNIKNADYEFYPHDPDWSPALHELSSSIKNYNYKITFEDTYLRDVTIAATIEDKSFDYHWAANEWRKDKKKETFAWPDWLIKVVKIIESKESMCDIDEISEELNYILDYIFYGKFQKAIEVLDKKSIKENEEDVNCVKNILWCLASKLNRGNKNECE